LESKLAVVISQVLTGLDRVPGNYGPTYFLTNQCNSIRNPGVLKTLEEGSQGEFTKAAALKVGSNGKGVKTHSSALFLVSNLDFPAGS
jgi:hypothetical protein